MNTSQVSSQSQYDDRQLYGSTKATFLTMDDDKIIEKFIQGSTQLLANQRIRIESNAGISQLIVRTGEIVAHLYLQAKPRTATIRTNSSYTETLDRWLVAQDFVCIGEAKQAGWLEYHHYVTPAGYQVYCTEPSLLWKKWWPTERFHNKQRFNMEILIRMKDNWYPIQNIFVHGGTFTVKTIAGQIALTANTRVLWIAQKGQEEPAMTAIEAPVTVAKNTTDLSAATARELTPQPSSIVHPPTPNAAIGTTPQPIDRPANPPAILLGESIAIAELQRHLHHQKHATAAAERRATKAEQRANIAEERLEIVYRYLRQIGVEPSQLYRDGQFTIEE